ncbi:asparagine synthase (glutamine-hydrolyzing), partial [bacterium]
MCGIAGFNWSNEPKAWEMAAALRHRGPDQSGVRVDESVSLAHARLSIIDLSEKGRQPMPNENGSLWLVVNGEIYNFRELREELAGKHTFSSATDTEVILHAYEEWGLDALRRFNGMWAFCLYDQKAQKLILSRDRAGKKPLYYFHDGVRFIFGSELKAIIQAHDIERRVSQDALDLYFSLGYIPSPWSVFEGIAKVEPRQFLVYDLGSRDLKQGRYYEIPDHAPIRDRGRLVREGRELLVDAVRLRLAADVPVGAFLSGGLDSSSVVAAIAAGTKPSRLHTFSIGFEGAYDETPFMEIVKGAFKTKHHHRYFTREDLDRDFGVLPFFFDEPFGDPASFPTFDLCRMASRQVTVCLSGDGGDEVFGGYRMHRRAARHAALRKVPAFIRKGIRKALRHARPGTPPGRFREVLRLSLLPAEEFYAEAEEGPAYKPEIYRKWSALKMREMLEKAGGNLVQAVIAYDLFVHALPDL